MICSICKTKLRKVGNSFQCENGHSFDIAKQGYVNLSRKQKKTGDNKAMVLARTNFLEKNPYDFMRKRVGEIIASYHLGSLLDIGCGQGYYTKTWQAEKKVGIDLSKEAIAYAAKHDRSTLYIVDTIYDLPFEADSFDCVVSVFTPLPIKEIERVLRPNGHLITVSPAREHLYELKQQLYEHVILNKEERENMGDLVLCHDEVITEQKEIDDIWDLFEMTPYRYKSPKDEIKQIEKLKKLNVTFSFLIKIFRKKVL